MHERYLSLLPADLRPDPPPHRESTWWRWRDMDVHIERVGDPAASGRVVMFHGAGGHAAALWPYAAIAATHGLHVVVPDLPGYGRTRVPRRGAVRYADWVSLACDLVRTERAEHSGSLLLAGASMGGMLAYDAATRIGAEAGAGADPGTGIVDQVIVTCLPDPRDSVLRRHIARNAWLSAAARPLLRVLAGPLANVCVPVRWLTNMRAIGNQPALVDTVVNDPGGGGNRMPLGFLRSFLDSAPAVEPEDATGPTFVLAHPDRDRWTPTAISLRFFDRIAAPKKLILLENAGHYPVESPGVHQLVDAIAAAATPGPAPGASGVHDRPRDDREPRDP